MPLILTLICLSQLDIELDKHQMILTSILSSIYASVYLNCLAFRRGNHCSVFLCGGFLKMHHFRSKRPFLRLHFSTKEIHQSNQILHLTRN